MLCNWLNTTNLNFCGIIGRKYSPSKLVTPDINNFGSSGNGRLLKHNLALGNLVKFSTSVKSDGSFNCCSAMTCGVSSGTTFVIAFMFAAVVLFPINVIGNCEAMAIFLLVSKLVLSNSCGGSSSSEADGISPKFSGGTPRLVIGRDIRSAALF